MAVWVHSNKMNLSLGPYCKFRNPKTSYRRRRHKSPATPLIHWKFDDKQHASGVGSVTVSARKLAAGLWQLRLLAQLSGVAGGGVICNPPAEQVKTNMHPLHRASKEYDPENKVLPQSPLLNCSPIQKIPLKHACSLRYPKTALEGATKWDPRCSKLSTEALGFYSHTKFLDGQFATFSVVSALQAELAQAQLRIHGLEDELRSSKKKYEHLMGKLGEERNSWQSTYNRMRSVIDNLKDELRIGSKSRKRIEIINSELVKELADAKSAANQLMQDYDKEKRARKLIEEVCNELAKKIGEYKAEMEVLKTETYKIRGELEEERRMLQLAEVWREERVQMKLLDAKLALEYKYHHMNKLVADLESYFRSRSETVGVMDLKEAEMIIQAVKSVSCQDTNEFEYVAPKSGGIFSFFDEIQPGEANEREMDSLLKYRPIHEASYNHTVNPEVNDFNNNHVLNHSNDSIPCNNVLNIDARIWESAGHINVQSIENSDHSAIRVNEGQIASRSKMECNEKVIQDSPRKEISEFCSVSGERPKQKVCSVSKVRRSSTSNGELCNITSDEGHGRFSNGTISSLGTASPHRKSVDGGLRQQDLVGRLVSPDSENPHITRGMKGSIEWPRGIQKNNFKAKCLKAIIKNQKTQLRNLLK